MQAGKIIFVDRKEKENGHISCQMVKSIKLSNGIYKKDYKNQICGLKTQNKRSIESPERQSIKRMKSLPVSQSSSSSYPLTQVPGDSKIDDDSFWTSDDKNIVDQTGLLLINCERCLLSLNFSALGDFLFFVLGNSVPNPTGGIRSGNFNDTRRSSSKIYY